VERWYDYYVAAGGAAAVLVGLLFVSLSLHLDRKASEYEVLYCVGTQTMIDLEAAPIGWQRFILGSSQSDCTAFLLFLVTKATRLLAQALSLSLAVALLMLVPISDPTVLGGVLLALSLGGALDSLRTIARRGWLHGWTHYVSLGCFAVLVLSALVLLFGAWGVGLYLVGPAIGMLIIAGTRNTWGLLLRARRRDAN
jgi:hypothetical protein